MKQSRTLVAITGGIGSGKSTATAFIKELGYPVFSCDEEVYALYKNRGILKTLKKEFPSAIKGKIFLSADKRKIAELCFSDKEKLLFLEKTLSFPALDRAIKKAKKHKGLVFIEVPLLFECKAESLFDKVIVVKRDKKERIESVKSRSSLSEKDILDRINRQIDYDAEDLSSYTVIENSSDLPALRSAVVSAIEKM